jgi:hypothetical protein
MGFCNLRSEPLFYVFICTEVGHEENVPRCQRWMEINVTHVRCSGIIGKNSQDLLIRKYSMYAKVAVNAGIKNI